jgi:hypothetical protein
LQPYFDISSLVGGARTLSFLQTIAETPPLFLRKTLIWEGTQVCKNKNRGVQHEAFSFVLFFLPGTSGATISSSRVSVLSLLACINTSTGDKVEQARHENRDTPTNNNFREDSSHVISYKLPLFATNPGLIPRKERQGVEMIQESRKRNGCQYQEVSDKLDLHTIVGLANETTSSGIQKCNSRQ